MQVFLRGCGSGDPNLLSRSVTQGKSTSMCPYQSRLAGSDLYRWGDSSLGSAEPSEIALAAETEGSQDYSRVRWFLGVFKVL